jgi:uncharacterized protein (TIGR02271 family)
VLEHIVAVFENDGAASAAERELQGAGIPASAIRRYAADAVESMERAPGAVTTETTTENQTGGGFWAWLLGEEGPSTSTSSYAADREAYDRRVGAGNVVLSVALNDDSQIHRAMGIIESHDPLEIDERTDEADAVSGVAPSTTGPAIAGMEYSSPAVAQASSVGAPAISSAAAPTNTSADRRVEGVGSDETISLSEEQLSVGKRTVDRGTTRIRRYVVETPVERDVTLHGERVTVERRKPLGDDAPGVGAFEERIVEMRETEEVPVVEKTARVAEELLVHRETTDRVEKVRDTVRREEVDVTRDATTPREEPKR